MPATIGSRYCSPATAAFKELVKKAIKCSPLLISYASANGKQHSGIVKTIYLFRNPSAIKSLGVSGIPDGVFPIEGLLPIVPAPVDS